MTRLLKSSEVAERLSISPLTVRKWIFTKRLPVRVGRAVRVQEEDLEALIRLGYEPVVSARRRVRAHEAGRPTRAAAER